MVRNRVINPRLHLVFTSDFSLLFEEELDNYVKDYIEHLNDEQVEAIVKSANDLGFATYDVFKRMFKDIDELNEELICEGWLRNDLIISFGMGY